MSQQDRDQAASICAAANVLDYELVLFHDKAVDDDYFVLTERNPKQRHWGTFVFGEGMHLPTLSKCHARYMKDRLINSASQCSNG